MGARTTKTTFYLDDSLRERLKTVAARQRKTVTNLLTEGAELVLARYQGALDRSALEERARSARETLRRGLFRGPRDTSVDAVVYRVNDSRRPRSR